MDELYREKLIKSIIETDIILEQINKENYEWYLNILVCLIIVIGFIVYYYYTTIDNTNIEINKKSNIFDDYERNQKLFNNRFISSYIH